MSFDKAAWDHDQRRQLAADRRFAKNGGLAKGFARQEAEPLLSHRLI